MSVTKVPLSTCICFTVFKTQWTILDYGRLPLVLL